MTDKTPAALAHLNRLLPLQRNQLAVTVPLRALHRAILRGFADTGRMPSAAAMRRLVDDPPAALAELGRRDMVTLDRDGNPTGAYPFTTRDTGHVVHLAGHAVHAMCALDALAVAPMFGVRTRVTSTCRVTGEPVEVEMAGEVVLNAEQVGDLHVGIAWSSADPATSCAASLCTEMVFLRDAATAQAWQADDAAGREIFTLPEAVRLGALFFGPLVED